MFTGGTIWILTHGHVPHQARSPSTFRGTILLSEGPGPSEVPCFFWEGSCFGAKFQGGGGLEKAHRPEKCSD